MNVARGVVAAAVAGALAGAIVGVGEALLVVSISGTVWPEYWLFLFAVCAYGALGAAIGVTSGVAWLLIRHGRADTASLAAVAAGVAFALAFFPVARLHLVLRVFQEHLPLASGTGILTHTLLALVTGALALGLAVALRRAYHAAGSLGTAAMLSCLVVAAFAVGRLTEVRPVVRVSTDGTAAGKPNIILIVVDTLRADALEPFGAAPGSTPSFLRLARDAVTFERAYAQASWTRPSVATMLTSQYPSTHGAKRKFDSLPIEALTAVEVLRAAGYWTSAFVSNFNLAPAFKLDQGFEEYVYLKPSFYFGATESAIKLSIYKALRALRERSQRMYVLNYYHDAAAVNRRAISWLEERPREPFFLMIHYMDPHDPHFPHPYDGRGVARVLTPNPAPERATELHEFYRQEVKYLDRHLGALWDYLRDSTLYERSMIVVTADHGEEFQDHGGWWHGATLYEEQIRIPLLIKRPSEPLRGKRRSDPVRTLDLAPSLLAAAGVAVPPSFEGRDLFSTMIGEPLIAEEDFDGNRLASIHVGKWKLITANPDNPRGLAPVELYDVASDPGERRNVANEQHATVAELTRELTDRLGRAASARVAAPTRGGLAPFKRP